MRKTLSDILYKCPVREVVGSVEQPISGIAFDSRHVQKGYAFVAIKGNQTDGHLFINQAIEKGATAIIFEEETAAKQKDIAFIKVENSALSLALMAGNYYDNPSQKLKLTGVTGTNGKTTIATLLYRLFSEAGYCCGLLSTIENKVGKQTLGATHTTPDPIALNAILHEMAQKGCSYVFMEVSSHALVQHRVSFCRWHIYQPYPRPPRLSQVIFGLSGCQENVF
jgi:UDP-N-acetylmuramoyl-L-alanyl-D-glutamate--2,6-diaminopimelate ligase